ncbi:hypothetical protein TVAG_337070 [Trichomonas vaginalis G3]|uniref:3'-5' exonuclease domain-containing protein n=1 Tax=Trichomonas vaginalis (strain ATCC PRA-98 / G3) TaxID=412133 RepID=A2EPX7_TRIV3|nr:hypothetical protein TVAGG3_0359490 [Trichomonas vaginalis G3]EAY05315.1 hypothetical protein TVAG_337070 [Trichomonas vaginalis G3]KAI5531849.1 hypothetical protein TVAGG3_0359490 [Trichomonas vaginalis G3]|eukprot:XP_001317538.1 hypothetical protein [Trichomonas vaginalis G3]
MAISDEVPCTITNCKHTVVYGNNNYKKLQNWVKDALYRMDFEKKVIIALDCEGYCLGSRPNSLGLIQFAECFTSDFFEKDFVPDHISINLKNGFLIKAPFSNGVKKLLSAVFSHPNLYIIMYDFTSDLTAITQAGIKVNKRNIVDGQAIQYFEDGTKYFGRKVTKSLKTACQCATNCVEFSKAKFALEYKDTVPFSKHAYELQNEKDPFSKMCTNEFLRYSSDDIALTAIALVSALRFVTPGQILVNSQKKVEGYKQLVDRVNNEMGAVLKRQFSFVPRIGSDFDDVQHYYDLWLSITNILNNYDMYQSIVKKGKQYDREHLEKEKNRVISVIKSRTNPLSCIINQCKCQKQNISITLGKGGLFLTTGNGSEYSLRVREV